MYHAAFIQMPEKDHPVGAEPRCARAPHNREVPAAQAVLGCGIIVNNDFWTSGHQNTDL